VEGVAQRLVELRRSNDAQMLAKSRSPSPYWIVEVLLPSNWLADRRVKLDVYARAGVREYWIVDVDARAIKVFVLQGRR
jgi:Uma2 family endonuclease